MHRQPFINPYNLGSVFCAISWGDNRTNTDHSTYMCRLSCILVATTSGLVLVLRLFTSTPCPPPPLVKVFVYYADTTLKSTAHCRSHVL